VRPTLDFLLDFRQSAHGLQRYDDPYEHDYPRDDGAEIVLACLVVAHHRPDNQHNPADDWYYSNEKNEHPFSNRNIIAVVRAAHTVVLRSRLLASERAFATYANFLMIMTYECNRRGNRRVVDPETADGTIT
jgi:hypothetical protein